jgi:transaldolase
MKPDNLKTKIFLDSCDPEETDRALKLLGFLDGQTTNPTLIAKHPKVKERTKWGGKFSRLEAFSFYGNVVKEISSLMPDGSVSMEVYSDKNSYADEMLRQAKWMNSLIPNAHIKFPTTNQGIFAGCWALKNNIRVNMTLCFDQEQAACVHRATSDLNVAVLPGDVFVSPFVGRLDDRGENGMDLIKNILQMYETELYSHVRVLTASVRTLNHFLSAINIGSDIVTAPLNILEEWAGLGMVMPSSDFQYHHGLSEIPYKKINHDRAWQDFNIAHELTDKGMERFAGDWNALIGGR